MAYATTCRCQGIEFVALNRENIYEYEGSVSVNAQTPWDQINLKPPQTSGWKIRGTVKLQHINDQTFAASVRKLNCNLIIKNNLLRESYQIITRFQWNYDVNGSHVVLLLTGCKMKTVLLHLVKLRERSNSI